MKPSLLYALMFVLSSTSLLAQSPAAVDIVIDPTRDTLRISPYIYGSNGQSDDRDENIAARRLGGNRITGYNWENNASNAGNDYNHQSDNYLTYTFPDSMQAKPGAVLTVFHDASLASGCYSLVTLPAAGYVARDKSGPVTPGETAPSPRWRKVEFAKGGPLSLLPDTSDNAVYVDEEVGFLVNRYGPASSIRGVRGYAVDNEPALWPSTHPRLHPAKPTVQEMIERTIGLARAVKEVDSTCEIFGAVAYGFSEYRTLQDAADWSQYTSYGTYLNAFVEKMKEAETAYGRRLLDVLDLHWYPEAQGESSEGWMRVALNENSEDGVARARMQAPRTLWDSSYREHSWIGEYFSPVALLPGLRATLNHHPGTKLAFTEINYGGDNHISGGIAMADVLGLFGRYDVYMSNYWGELEGYVSAAYKIYRNYDGARSAFGSLGVRATVTDAEKSSAFASLDSLGRLHLVAINKEMSGPLTARFTIDGPQRYAGGTVYGFNATSPTIARLDTITSIVDGKFLYTLPQLSVVHIVLDPVRQSSVPTLPAEAGSVRLEPIRPNPVRERGQLRYTLHNARDVRLALVDPLGREILLLDAGPRSSGSHTVDLDAASLASGTYHVRLDAGGVVAIDRIVVVK